MSGISGREVVGVHLVTEGLHRGVDEERGVGGPGYAPDYVWRGVVVPGVDFGEDTDTVSRGG